MKSPSVLNIPTLSDSDWSDNDVVMFHACFHLLEDCIVNEKLLTGNTNWEHNEEYRNAKQEIVALYEWWQERKVVDDSNHFLSTEREQYKKDDEMLIRLIKIRRYLWT